MVGLYGYSLNRDVQTENSRFDAQVSSSLEILKDHLRNLIIYTEVISQLQARAVRQIGEKAGEWAEKNFDSFLVNVPELYGFALVEKGKTLMQAGFHSSDIPQVDIEAMGKQKTIIPARLEVRPEYVTRKNGVRLLPLTQRIAFDGHKVFAVVFFNIEKLETLVRSSLDEGISISALVDNSGKILVAGKLLSEGEESNPQKQLNELLAGSNLTFSQIIATRKKTTGKEQNFTTIAASPFPLNLIAIYQPPLRLSQQLWKLGLFAVGTFTGFILFVFFFYRTSTSLDAHQDHLEGLVEARTGELEQRTGLLQAILGSMTQGIAAFDKELKLIAWNEQFLKIRDYPRELTHEGAHFEKFMAFDANRNEFGLEDPELNVQQQIARSLKFEVHEFERQRPDGTFIEVRGGPIPGGGFVSTFTNITERKKAEEQISLQRQNLRHVLEGVAQGIVKWGPDQRLISWNKHYREVLDLPKDLLIEGRPLSEVTLFVAKRGDYGPGNPEEVAKARVDFLMSGAARRNELTIGKDHIYDVFIQPTDDGGVIITYTDITERKKAENRLVNAYDIISGSIDYAARIQRSVLPDEKTFSSRFTDHFIMWEPRDVVGGDIYWNRAWGKGRLVILGDCTGHGVPGAFMTLIATGGLNNALLEVPEGEVANLMQRIHQQVQLTLGQHKDRAESDDGMELGICYFSPDMDELIFVGARFELYQVKSGEVEVIKGTKSGIGYSGIPFDQSFDEHKITEFRDVSFYMSSDGLVDQIGGEKSRMFGKKRFRQLLADINANPMAEQKSAIEHALVNYQGIQRRRDDIAVIGFKI